MCSERTKTELTVLKMDWQELKYAAYFTYLGTVVNNQGGTEEDIDARDRKTTVAFKVLKQLRNQCIA